MKTFARGSTVVLAIAAFAMACTDPASPDTRVPSAGPMLAIIDQIGNYPQSNPDVMTAGDVRVCKTIPAGDPNLTFTFTATVTPTIPPGVPLAPVQYQINGVGGSTVCTDVFTSTKNGAELDQVVIVESAPPVNWALTAIDFVRIDDGAGYDPPAPGNDVTAVLGTRTATVYVNNDMGRIVTFTNDFTPPTVTGCTYTKGWYRNNGSSTVIAVDGRTVAEAQAIFNATPGKPGAVTFGGDNTLLNLYQQLLAALNNLGGDANAHDGPDAVDDAIDDALAGTGGSGTNITTTLTQTEMSDLIDTLSAFNEGTFTGWPHCDDN